MCAAMAQLDVGDRIPCQLDAEGEPQWLTVVEVLGIGAYFVRFPDGSMLELHDSE